ncbi:MAG: hypothetical protein MUE30_12805 [Spirosomaceae bacterium]|nr:hypothetical protein [Spirosomataceae bacterium]
MNRLIVFLLVCTSAFAQTPLTIEQPRVEYKTNPIGIDATEPRFSKTVPSRSRQRCQVF